MVNTKLNRFSCHDYLPQLPSGLLHVVMPSELVMQVVLANVTDENVMHDNNIINAFILFPF